jgi:hypothetical protein
LVPERHWNPLKGTNIFFAGAGPEVLQHQEHGDIASNVTGPTLHGLEHRISEALSTMVLHLGTQGLTRSYQNRLILRKGFHPINHIDTEQLSPVSLTQDFEKIC